MTDLTFSANSILNVGYSPKAVGLAFSMDENELTIPFKIDDGVMVLKLNGKIKILFNFGVSIISK